MADCKRKAATQSVHSDEDDFVGPMPPAVPAKQTESVTVPSTITSSKENKEKENRDSDNDDADIVGPPCPTAATVHTKKPRKKRVLANEQMYLDRLPLADMYERSFMHREPLSLVAVTKTDFIITTSTDGHLKFWKKMERGVEFVKHFRSHLGSIIGMAVSADGTLLATIATDKTLKVYDVINFDMINMFKLEYLPRTVCWTYQSGKAQALVAVSDADTPLIYMYDGRGEFTPVYTTSAIHSKPVILMKYNELHDCVVSVDQGGIIEYWTPNEQFSMPTTVSWQFKTETDLYEFVKGKSVPVSLEFSPDGSMFATMNMDDRQVRVFRFATGRLHRKYDESLAVASEMQQAGTAVHRLDDMEFGRRMAVEKDLQSSSFAQFTNAIFDESGNFILYPSLLGIKVVNLVSNKVSSIIGKGETTRFLNLALYQGAPKKKVAVTLAMAASDNPTLQITEQQDPTLVCTGFKKNRFYLFTRREPDSIEAEVPGGTGRDVFNEKPSREEQTVAADSAKPALGSTAIMHTTHGDIFLKLFPGKTPKTVENFVTHAKNGYYDGVLFHRVIRGFMIQTGDPLGNGTGGESIWGHDFEDEFDPGLKHDQAYTLSMANAGPNTNGSQFFITTAPTPWLDKKHTIFGRATGGIDVIHAIEHVSTDKQDRPRQDIKIINIEVR